MAGMQFEYDEKGGTFYYFLLSFLALILLPLTFYLWPRSKSTDHKSKTRRQCHCEPCQMKKQLLKANEPWAKMKTRAIKVAIILGWIMFAFVAYKASQVELDLTDFDPYAELEIDRGADTKEVKKAYRKLSMLHHPDRGGDPIKFMKITKAHQALTDEEARKNWEEYGNPDGPGATHFGIALPKWIVEKQNSVWVLAVYGLVFMVILPVVVGTWWYRSIKFSSEQILMDTTQLYYYFFHKSPNMILKRVLMILAASLEFEKSRNSEIVERPSDNEEIPMLMRELTNLNQKNKEKPLCYPYSIKARALLHAHLTRLELPPKSLEIDKQYIVKKCPYLINEMVNIVAQLVALAHGGRVPHCPRLETVEYTMRLSQMVVQALWENKSPLLQLPHITEPMLRHFVGKRRNVRNIRQFVSLKEEERRSVLRCLTDDEYRDVMNVCATLPDVSMEVTSKVLDDEDTTITAGSIVTVTVRLERKSMEDLLGKETFLQYYDIIEKKEEGDGDNEHQEEEGDTEEQPQEQAAEATPVKKPKAWEKQWKKKGKGGKKGKKGDKQKYIIIRKNKPAIANVGANSAGSDAATANGSIPKGSKKSGDKDENQSTDEEDMSDNEVANISENDNEEQNDMDDEEDWLKFQQESKKENALETRSKETYPVHCPYYPGMKYEWWWLYVANRKNHSLVTAPVQVCSLRTTEEIQLKFSAPPKVGKYQYTVILRSDSYLDFDLTHNIKLDVKAAKKIESHPQWDISDDEDKDDNDDGTESEGDSDYDDSDED